MRGTWGGAKAIGGLLLACALATSGCSALVPTPDTGDESMPGPASVWLTADPATPDIRVPVEMTSLDDPAVRLGYTFPPGDVLRGDFATSEGRYRMAALAGACSILLPLGGGQSADVVLTLIGPSHCTLDLVLQGDMGDPAMQHEEPAIFITNGGVTR